MDECVLIGLACMPYSLVVLVSQGTSKTGSHYCTSRYHAGICTNCGIVDEVLCPDRDLEEECMGCRQFTKIRVSRRDISWNGKEVYAAAPRYRGIICMAYHLSS